MNLALLLLLTIFPFQRISNLEVTPLTFDAKLFKDAFNIESDKPRIVGVFSPTCGHCLQACSELQEILERHPDARVQVFILWTPFMANDNRTLAQRASAYIADNRVRHFWDLWRFGSRTYAQQLKLPPLDAWDMYALYKPHLIWRDSIPLPTVWMQNRNLDIGTPYKQEALENELKKWLD
jgi:hypothetical protein